MTLSKDVLATYNKKSITKPSTSSVAPRRPKLLLKTPRSTVRGPKAPNGTYRHITAEFDPETQKPVATNAHEATLPTRTAPDPRTPFFNKLISLIRPVSYVDIKVSKNDALPSVLVSSRGNLVWRADHK